ncbi:MAG: hypothetical protein IK016_03150 [Lachnospiraceae bacterium]|nr:hypothetical protein [Lachnospiraceae bacterium]
MKTKILGSAAVVHFCVDLSCIWLLHHLIAYAGRWWYLGYLFYNFCAFALQLPIGMLLDHLCENRSTQEASRLNLLTSMMGCILLAATALLRQGNLLTVLGAGFANAFFHIGCGADLLRLYDGTECGKGKARIGRHGAQGIFVPAGGFGLFVGALLPYTAAVYGGIVAALVLSSLLMAYVATRPLTASDLPAEGVAHGRQSLSGMELLTTSVCMFLAAMLHTSTEISFAFTWKTGFAAGLAVALCALFGKMAGGLLADRLGLRRVLLFSLAGASLLLLFSEMAGAGMAGLLLYHMSMPLFFSGIYDLFPGRPAFAYGLVKAAIFVGYVPVYAGLDAFIARPVWYGILTFLSLLMVLGFCLPRALRTAHSQQSG